MEAEASPAVAVRDVGGISGSEPKPLTIKTLSPASESISASVSSSMPITPHLNSPSPPSSAFVSALQSPYISPRAVEPPKRAETPSSITASPSPISFSGDEIPSTSCTTSERYDLSSSEPRISFSFSPCANSRLRSCDVYIGFHGQTLHLPRFCKWLRSELELQGIASFAADRSKISDSQSRQIADRIIRSATYGIVAVTAPSFLTPLAVEEIKFFAQKKNLIPLLFGTEISGMSGCGDTLERLARSSELRLEANDCNWRSCVTKAVTALQIKLARKSAAAEKERGCSEELPLPRNSFFVGREKEMSEIEAAFFGRSPEVECTDGGGSSDECNGGYICLEMRKCQEPALEAWIEPRMEMGSMERSRRRSKSRSVVCISGVSGIGKTELALEFAYRHSQRYKMVLWVGGEARHLRQNILNLSMSLGLDVSAEAERERGICRNFDEQECDAFQRVRRDLFRDVPFLLVIDNLETEKDLQDLIPRNTGASHVIITTRLSKAMNSDPIALLPLSLSDSSVLIRGRRRREDFPAEELEALRNLGERLGRLSFGLWLIGSLLSELAILPSALLEAIERMPLGQISVSRDECLPNNPFLLKTLAFSFAILERAEGRRSSALGIIFAGAWLAPAPVSSELLAAAVAEKRKALSSSLCFRLSSQSSKSGAESAALMIVKLGLARISTMQPGCHIQFHAITRLFSRIRGGTSPAKSSVLGVRKSGITASNSSHLWASAFLLFGFKSEPPIVRLDVFDTVLFIKKIAIPLAIQSFTAFSSCNSALELLKVSTDVLEEVEKSFVLRNEEWSRRSLCWKKRLKGDQRVDEYVWQEVTLLKASLLETRAKLLLRGGLFDTGEELCRTCISIRTVMLGHNHAQTLAAQETLAKLVRYRSKV